MFNSRLAEDYWRKLENEQLDVSVNFSKVSIETRIVLSVVHLLEKNLSNTYTGN